MKILIMVIIMEYAVYWLLHWLCFSMLLYATMVYGFGCLCRLCGYLYTTCGLPFISWLLALLTKTGRFDSTVSSIFGGTGNFIYAPSGDLYRCMQL